MLTVIRCAPSSMAAERVRPGGTIVYAVCTINADECEAVVEASGIQAPRFEVDPMWPKIPRQWILGQVSGLDVDARDHVWIIHRPRNVPADQRANAAPAVTAVIAIWVAIMTRRRSCRSATTPPTTPPNRRRWPRRRRA